MILSGVIKEAIIKHINDTPMWELAKFEAVSELADDIVTAIDDKYKVEKR